MWVEYLIMRGGENMKNMERTITLYCGVCGSSQLTIIDKTFNDFSEAPGYIKIKCESCGNITTKDDLLEENRYHIESNIEDIKKEAIKEFEKEIKKRFK